MAAPEYMNDLRKSEQFWRI